MGTRLHAREILVLNTLFSSDSPMTSLDIIMTNKGLSQSTVQAVLRKLQKQELVEVTGVVHSGNVLARTYKGTQKAREEVLQYILEEYEKMRGILSVSDAIKALVNAESDKSKRIALLQQMLEMLS